VFVHGDFHPDNQLWDPRDLRLLLVVHLETSGAAEPEYDFRVIPSFGPGVDLLTSTFSHYETLTGRRLSLERIMALHVRTTLGDALWRSEAGLPLLLPAPGRRYARRVRRRTGHAFRTTSPDRAVAARGSLR
jgi:aminoglycoside phosphotransferase (APT) family kinase protein